MFYARFYPPAWVILALVLAMGCTDNAQEDIMALLMAQQEAWNAGDIDAFMEGYVGSDELRFVSSSGEIRGWDSTLARYHRAYPDRAAMGQLTFDIRDVRVLSSEYAFIYGAYMLERADDRPTGLFTLLAANSGQGWRIVHDHTSADEVHASSD
ncbi:MAG: nuclear transport factor 2 family protein [Bacteroidota bacterium]|nr:nuclear transport factor 2 family protein [Bacteroidota bacterium]